MPERMKEWRGFAPNQKVKTLIETKGEDYNGIEHIVSPGAVGFVDSIERYTNGQGVAVTVVIKTSSDDPESHIVNVFDELDGPIENFVEAV